MTKGIEYTEWGMLLPEIDNATRREFLIGSAGLLLLPAACGGNGESEESASGETRTVEHLLGTTEVPVNPERVVALDGGEELEALCALGEAPLAAGNASRAEGADQWFEYIESRCDLDPVEVVPGRDQANLEQVAALQPDLIFATDFEAETYDELSRIAPTVIPDRRSGAEKLLRTTAEAVGRPEAADEAVRRIEERKMEVAETLPDDLEISIATTDGEAFGFYWPTPTYLENAPALLRELGVRRPERQREAVGGDEYEESDSFDVSPERLGLLDGQHMFVFLVGEEGEVRAELADNPLWQSLDAVQNERVRFVERHWVLNGPLAQLAVLDELERWFGQR